DCRNSSSGRLQEAVPASSTQTETYVGTRSVTILPAVIRHHANLLHGPTGKLFPAMIVPIVNIYNQVIGLHRTFLASNGSGKAPRLPQQDDARSGHGRRRASHRDRLLVGGRRVPPPSTEDSSTAPLAGGA